MPRARPEAAYLELLTRRAPVEAYDGPLSEARAAGAPPEELAALESGKLLALRVRAELEGRRRREAELSALFETAHDLAGLRDLDAVLRAIVQRARSLLGTEVAYLTLTDNERGDTYMRVTEGSVSARFQQLRLGMGEGLGGLVAQTARPYVTDDYFDGRALPAHRRHRRGRRRRGPGRHPRRAADAGRPPRHRRAVRGGPPRTRLRARTGRAARLLRRLRRRRHRQRANLLAETRSALAALERPTRSSGPQRGDRASRRRPRPAHRTRPARRRTCTDVAAAVSEVLDGTVEFVEPVVAAARAAVERSRNDGHAVRARGRLGGRGLRRR